jgi:hypothetical protein
MQAVEGIFRERVRFAKTKLSGGDTPAPAQLAAFLRALVASLRPHTAAIPVEAKKMLQETFQMASWDVMCNAPLAGCSRPCSPGELVAFLETAQKRIRMGVVTAGWGDYKPVAAQPVAPALVPGSGSASSPAPATPVEANGVAHTPATAASPAPAEDAVAVAARRVAKVQAQAANAARASLESEAAALMEEPAVLSLVERLETNPDAATMATIAGDLSLQRKLAVLLRAGVLQPPDASAEGEQLPPGMAELFTGDGELARAVAEASAAVALAAGLGEGDTPLLVMTEEEAIRQLQVEIEEQLERNHFRALGI